eukprot:gnl/Spiro4/28188_TR13944_c0_g1_i1.p1 gnl/Spiro4/28188_TR13944_c0_g1~~gnl/Spiro4/28188_TR13944_c0_g1_i1.p1  ORF type:complete len:207 (+),score=58.04 gnl/Spiro4/28188_TR13944_c0_g1_i1:85-621(+)
MAVVAIPTINVSFTGEQQGPAGQTVEELSDELASLQAERLEMDGLKRKSILELRSVQAQQRASMVAIETLDALKSGGSALSAAAIATKLHAIKQDKEERMAAAARTREALTKRLAELTAENQRLTAELAALSPPPAAPSAKTPSSSSAKAPAKSPAKASSSPAKGASASPKTISGKKK